MNLSLLIIGILFIVFTLFLLAYTLLMKRQKIVQEMSKLLKELIEKQMDLIPELEKVNQEKQLLDRELLEPALTIYHTYVTSKDKEETLEKSFELYTALTKRVVVVFNQLKEVSEDRKKNYVSLQSAYVKTRGLIENNKQLYNQLALAFNYTLKEAPFKFFALKVGFRSFDVI